MKLKTLLVNFLLTSSLSISALAESSAFGAGNLESDKPYGLTESEKHIVKNQEALGKLGNKVYRTSDTIKELKENIEGLRTIVDDDSRKLNNLRIKLNIVQKHIDEQLVENKTIKDKISLDISELSSLFDANIKKQEEDIAKLRSVLIEMNGMVDSINTNYVSKSEMKDFQEEIFRQMKALEDQFNRGGFETQSNAAIDKEARKLYKNKSFAASELRFRHLIKNHYRPAASNFYLGEIMYYQKRYKEALDHYKKSVSLYAKASYMPTLLLHSGISCEKSEDNDGASQFYLTLIESFPQTKSATVAKKRLQNLQ